MVMNRLGAVVVTAALSVGCLSMAHGADDSRPWSGKVGLGYLASSGNTDDSSLNASLALAYDLDSWHHAFSAQAIGNVSNDVTTAERYQANFKSKYDFTEHDYLFGLVNWEKDRFGGYEQQVSEAIGYGRRLINSDTQVLNVELGAGAKQSDLFDGTSESGTIARAGLDYLWKFSETAQFTQLVAVESGSGNTYIESVTAIKSLLRESLALSVSYTIKSNSDVPAGRDETDTYTAINLEYGF